MFSQNTPTTLFLSQIYTFQLLTYPLFSPSPLKHSCFGFCDIFPCFFSLIVSLATSCSFLRFLFVPYIMVFFGVQCSLFLPLHTPWATPLEPSTIYVVIILKPISLLYICLSPTVQINIARCLLVISNRINHATK